MEENERRRRNDDEELPRSNNTEEKNRTVAMVVEEVAAAETNQQQGAAAATPTEDGLKSQIQHLQSENQKMQSEFNAQRAKLKELFIQKETEHSKCLAEKDALQRELDEMKSQFLVADLKSENELAFKEMKAQEEILSLQQLVQDTIEESAICKNDLERLKEECERLKAENRDLREELQQQEMPSLGPQVLNQVKKTLKKTAGTVLNTSFQQESADESPRNKSSSAKQYEHEDAEVLRSIVEQLQEEMKALKEKLREADEKLRLSSISSSSSRANEASAENATNTDGESSATVEPCVRCASTEEKLESVSKEKKEALEKIQALEKSLQESREDLEKEASLRKDLEEQWQEKREIYKNEVQSLREQVKSGEKQLLDLQQKFLETKEEVIRQLQRVTDDRERVNKQLETLQADNDFLSGRYLATADEIESQYINLPNNVEELQELVLKQRDDLIQARVSSEFEKQKCVTSLDEIQILRDQLDTCNNERRAYKKKVLIEMKSLQDRLTEHLKLVQSYESTKAALERKESELNRQISEMRVEIIELQDANEKLTRANNDYKSKIKILQDGLANGEQVQRDFVKLSQTLQMSLEKLRHADSEVRWQDDDDVDNCPSCNVNFTVTVRKFHCRHCGHIYCDKCLSKTVPSGPRRRNARVCDICHTLLQPNTAPYFSHESAAQ